MTAPMFDIIVWKSGKLADTGSKVGPFTDEHTAEYYADVSAVLLAAILGAIGGAAITIAIVAAASIHA